MFRRAVAAVFAVAVIGAAFSIPGYSSSLATYQGAKDSNWNCDPDLNIGGYFHCSAPGKPSLLELIEGDAAPPSLMLRAYDANTLRFAGVETLRRADLFSGDENTACPQDPNTNWVFLDFPDDGDYFACHRFDT